MISEQPRLIFLHCWANDDAMKLAQGLRAALDKTRHVPVCPLRSESDRSVIKI
jgi:hypothetical protein